MRSKKAEMICHHFNPNALYSPTKLADALADDAWQSHCICRTSVAPCLGSSRSGIPWNKHLVSILVQDTPEWTSEHMAAAHLSPTSASMLVMTPSTPQSGCSRWPLTLVWSSLVVQDIRMPETSEHLRHQNLQVIQTGPTPEYQDKP